MKKIPLTLSAGALLLGPLLAATMREHKVAIKQAQRGELEPLEMLDLTCTLATACAQRVNPAVTIEQVEGIVDMENFGQVFSACWGVSVPAPDQDAAPGEAVQAARPST